MSIETDIRVLNDFAKSQGWYRGAQLNEYKIPELKAFPKISASSYEEMFKVWKWQFEDDHSSRRRRLNCRYWAFYYIWIINCLINGEKDGKAIDLHEISSEQLKQAGFLYPDQWGILNYIEEGLKEHFGFSVAKRSTGHRLFLTGIGRQSGYFYEKYAAKFKSPVLSWYKQNLRELAADGTLAQKIQEQELIAPSYILRGADNDLDYELVADFYRKIAQASLQGIFNKSYIDQLSDYFSLPLPVVEKVLNVFSESDTAISSAGFDLVLEKRGICYQFASSVDLSIYGVDQNAFITIDGKQDPVSYRMAGAAVWKSAALTLPVSQNPELLLRYRSRSTLNELDITPADLQEDPVLIFTDKNKHVRNGFGKVRLGRTYFAAVNPGLWKNNYTLVLTNQEGREVIKHFHEGQLIIDTQEWTGLGVLDSSDQLIYVREFTGAVNLSPEFSEAHLCPHTAGKRTFSRFPEIDEEGLDFYDTVEVLSGTESIYFAQNVSLPVNLEALLDGHQYGKFCFKASAGNRTARRTFTVLPYDFRFSASFECRHSMTEEVSLCVTSEELLPEGIAEVTVNPEASSFEASLSFADKSSVGLKGFIKRRGGLLEVGDLKIPFSDELKYADVVNIDELRYKGVLTVAAEPYSVVGIRFHCGEKKSKPDFSKRADKAGRVRVSFPDIRRSCSPGIWDNCNSISLLEYQQDKRVSSLGIIKTESFSTNKFTEIKIEEDGTLTVEKDIWTSGDSGIKSLGLAVVPVDSQHIAPFLLTEKPHNFSEFETIAGLLKVCGNDKVIMSVSGFKERFCMKGGCIVFLVQVDWEGVRRISRGGFVPGEIKTGRLMAFEDLIADSDVEERFSQGGAAVEEFIDGLFKNAELLDAYNYLSLISAANPREITGHVFRAVAYWMEALEQLWSFKYIGMEVNTDANPVLKRVEHLDAFWDRQLFGYDAVKRYVDGAAVIDMKNARNQLADIFSSPPHEFSSWHLLTGIMKFPELCAEANLLVSSLKKRYLDKLEDFRSTLEPEDDILDFIRTNMLLQDSSLTDWDTIKRFIVGLTPNWLLSDSSSLLLSYLQFLAWEVHIWRRSPSISLQSNLLRNQLKYLRKEYVEYANYLNIVLVEIYLKEREELS